jgi:hypothetical protein
MLEKSRSANTHPEVLEKPVPTKSKAQPIKSEASRIIELLILCEQKFYPDKLI